jgi:hypothetical protein
VMNALALDFAPDRTGPPPVGTRRPPFLGDEIPDAGSGHGAIIVEENWSSNSATAPIESFVNLDNKTIAQVLCDVRDADASHMLYFSGHGLFQQPYLDLAESDAPSSVAVDLRPSLSRWRALFQPSVDAARLAHVYLTACTSGSSAVDLRPSLSCWRALLRPNIDAARLAHVYLTACDPPASAGLGSSAVELHPSLSLCLRAVYERQTVLTEAQAAALKRQLRVLLEDEEELQSANISVSMPSLHGLIDFLSEHQTSPLPSLSVTQAGYFAASWSPRKRAKLTVIFRPEGVADWIASDLNAPSVHQKDTLANRLGEFAAWTNA